jgi:hypothetical protein
MLINAALFTPREDRGRPVTQRRWTMPTISSAQCAFDNARRRGALALFRLASTVLRGATDLFQKHRISRVDLRVVLATAKLLERCAGLLLLGLGRHHD